MALYRMLIKPQICYPDQYYNAVCRDLEEDGKWYSLEEKEAIKKKYKHLENTVEQVVFDVKYEPIDAIPVEWLRDWQDEVGTINEWWPIIERIITVWHEEQEGRT